MTTFLTVSQGRLPVMLSGPCPYIRLTTLLASHVLNEEACSHRMDQCLHERGRRGTLRPVHALSLDACPWAEGAAPLA